MTLMIEFILFIFVQGLFINGVKEAMREGNILFGFYKIAEKLLGPYWSKPVGGCIKCMASIGGAITYWPTVIYVFGFRWVEFPVFVVDVFCLVVVNWFIYKKM